MDNAYAVILAGGRGERFWPLSRAARPKQLLALTGDSPLIAEAVQRLDGLIPPERVLVITNADLVDATREAVPEVPPEQVIGEPVGRDTAPAVALALALVRHRDPDGVFCVLTADHIIGDIPLFQKTLRAGLETAAHRDAIVTIGIEPTEPATGYGYIQCGEREGEVEGIALYRADSFREKPDDATARHYLEAGRYLWNSGMFIWSARTLKASFEQHAPALADLAERMERAAGTDGFEATLAEVYRDVRKISIDYALMEHADEVLTIPGTFPWDDVGAWTALPNHLPADEDGNTALGTLEALDAQNNIVYSPDRLTALIGVDDLVVIHAEGATLVCHRSRAQEIKNMVARLRERGDDVQHLL